VRVALTFDAEHPSRPTARPGVQDAVLALLRERAVRATFFIQGRWATAYPALARAIVADGHLIGSHSHFHARLPLLTDEGLRVDVAHAEGAIIAACGTTPRPWFRAPYGDVDGRVLGVLGELGYRHVGWDVIADDWEEGRTGDDVARTVLDGVRDDVVVVLPPWPGPALDALPRILDGLAGADLVTVADVL